MLYTYDGGGGAGEDSWIGEKPPYVPVVALFLEGGRPRSDSPLGLPLGLLTNGFSVYVVSVELACS